MKRFAYTLVLMLICFSVFSGCSDAEKVYPIDKIGTFNSAELVYENEHFGIKGVYDPSLTLEPRKTPDAKEKLITEINIHNVDYSFHHYLQLYSKDSIELVYRALPIKQYTKDYVNSLVGHIDCEVLKEAYADEFILAGESVTGYTSDIEVIDYDSGYKKSLRVTVITLDAEPYYCNLLIQSTDKERAQKFLNSTYSALN